MLRKLLLPLAAAGLLAGCATGQYAYRGGAGDYYYGRPQVEYRHYGSPYGYYGPHYRPGLYGYYGSPYYGYPFYGHPYYGHPYYRPPVIVQPRPDDGARDRDDRPPPWRDLGARRRVVSPDAGGAMRPPEPARPLPEARREGGSRMEQMLRRGREGVRPSSATEER